MKTFENVTKAVIAVGMIAFTGWIIISLYIPALSYLHSDMGLLALVLGFVVATLFTVLVWGFVGMGFSYILTAFGVILGAIIEGISTLIEHHKRV
ncbi:hypothetical protein [Glaesserella parasuis]|uniref:hypothetical protein n=1 Tax=Glaesserella parasuis TaxID=738 RepID=UPI0004A02E93|nr:hypothetical protein [Glaesserella parasuis]KDD82430.1 hypothetical protein HPS42_00050 [Glaesserella parasuis ST4-2]